MNANDILRKDFKEIQDQCKRKDGWRCKTTGWACRDVICPILPLVESLEEAKKMASA